MSERDEKRDAHATPPPRSADEAIARARQHALAATAEAVLALRALLDAASLATTGAPSDSHAALVGASGWLDQIAAQLRSDSGHRDAPWLDAVARVLDAEIERWETRGRDDPEARAVLRAFLGVREILWEFGLRPGREAASDGAPHEPSRDANVRSSAPRRDETPSDSLRTRAERSPRRARPARIERVPVKG